MRKSEFKKLRSRIVPSLSEVKKRLGVKEPEEREPPFIRLVIRHVMWSSIDERWPDAPKVLKERTANYGAGMKLPSPYECRTWRARPGRRLYYKFETERFNRMFNLVVEEAMDHEVAVRTGELPIAEWEPGQKVRWTKALVQSLLDHIANGGTYLSFATQMKISRAAVVEFTKREEIAPLVAKAAQYGVDAMAEAALEVAGRPCIVEEVIETVSPDGTVLQKNVRRRDQVEARKLAYESRMRYLAKIAPNRYGDKPEVQETASMAEKILKARKRLGG